MTQILMKVKDITNFYQIPVILISHLRKKEKDRGLPSQEDFFGTSNIAKICSQAIVLYPFYKEDNFISGIYPTFFRFVKSRTGLRSSIAALCNFNVQKGGYEESYEIYKLNGDLPFDKPLLNHEKPSWAYKRNPV